MISHPDVSDLRPVVRVFDLSTPTKVHIVGIGGAGMRAIAQVLLAMGHTVTGSDRAASPHLDRLSALGADVAVGHAPELVQAAQVVTRSTAVGDDDADVAMAFSLELSVLSRAEVLAAISKVRPALLVAGTHGKTTTSSMLAVILDEAELAPSFIIGSDVARFGTGAAWSTGPWNIIEADESDGTFLALAGAHAIVTSLDPDHLEFYGSRERLDAAFVEFVGAVEGTTVICLDDPDIEVLLDAATSPASVVTYGQHRDAMLRIDNLQVERHGCRFDGVWRGTALGKIIVGLPGRHNALNAAGALALALSLDVDLDRATTALAHFGGVARRFEFRGSADGVSFVDDYAHLPAEVVAAVSTARNGNWGRVIATYQPHRFSRTEALGHTFAGSFDGVDQLILSGIYPSGEAPREGVTGRIVYDAVVAATPALDVVYAETLDDVVAHLASVLTSGDLCLTLGAGDLTSVPDIVIARLWNRWAARLSARLANGHVEPAGSVGSRTTYRAGGSARAVVTVQSVAELRATAEALHDRDVAVLLVGRGSNMLVADAGFDGVAIVLDGEFDKVSIIGDRVTAGGAVLLPTLARKAAAASLSGFEWAVGVPGSVGGAVAMNAGGHGSDMAASLVSARIFDMHTGQITTHSLDELGFGYRTSSIAAHEVVLDATLRLDAGDRAQSEAAISEIVRWRREHQPGGQNAGSVFTNPDGDSAGRLLDQAGAKGLRVGSAEVSTKHANFIQVDADGSADDVFELMHLMVDRVLADSGIALHPETRLIGFAAFNVSSSSETALPTPKGGL